MTVNRFLFLAVGLVEFAYGFSSASSLDGVASSPLHGLWFQGAGEVACVLGPIALRGEARWRAARLAAGHGF